MFFALAWILHFFLDVTIFANLFFYSMDFLFSSVIKINMTNKGIKCITVLAMF